MADTDANKPITRAEMDAALDTLAMRLTETMREIETNLLTAFYGYAKGVAGRLGAVEVADQAISVRMAALEERVLNLETRRPH